MALRRRERRGREPKREGKRHRIRATKMRVDAPDTKKHDCEDRRQWYLACGKCSVVYPVQ